MADMSFLKEFEKDCAKMEGVTSQSAPPRYWFGSGNYAMNYVLSGDFQKCIPQGRITAIAGPSGAGKSFSQCNIVREAQAAGAYILMIDSENSLDDDFVSKIGVDVSEWYNYKSVITIDNVINLLSSFISKYRKAHGDNPDAPKIVIVVDSLDMLLTSSELAHFAKGDNSGDQGQRAKQIKAMLRQLVQQIKSLNISIVVTHQVYAANQAALLKGEGAWIVNDAVRYSLSQIALTTKLKLKDDSGIAGIRMKVEGFKTRFTKPFQSVVIEVPYESGMDPCSGLCEMMEAVGVIQPAGSYKRIKDTEIKFYRRDISQYLDQLFDKFKSLGDDVSVVVSTDEEEEKGESEAAHSARRRAAERIAAAALEISEE